MGALDRVELAEGALGDEFLAQAFVLGLRAVAPDHPVRLRQVCDLVDPGDQSLVVWWGRRVPRCRAPRLLLNEGFLLGGPMGAATRMLHGGALRAHPVSTALI
ncbi:hypothetical protein GCM10023238_35060 [Streptomyces heliomycini]